jgi:hypothetical protein
MSQSRALIPIENQVDLARLYEYHNLKSRMERARTRYYKLYASSMDLAARYLDEMPEAKLIIHLRREIRLAVRGTPQTYAQDAITTAGYVSAGTEQLYNGMAHLAKVAYRAVAGLVHPDRGGDPQLFQLALAAYRMNDLTYLQELYLRLVKDNVFWRCSAEARDYLKQEIKRPEVSLTHLQTRPEFQIVMFHQSGKPDVAREVAQLHATRLIVMLQAELNHLLGIKPNDAEQENGDNEEGSEEDRSDKDCGEDWSGQ